MQRYAEAETFVCEAPVLKVQMISKALGEISMNVPGLYNNQQYFLLNLPGQGWGVPLQPEEGVRQVTIPCFTGSWLVRFRLLWRAEEEDYAEPS